MKDKVPARLLLPTEEEEQAFERKVKDALSGVVRRPRIVPSVAFINSRPPRYLPSVVVLLPNEEEYERARLALLSGRFATTSREYGEEGLRVTQLGNDVSPLRTANTPPYWLHALLRASAPPALRDWLDAHRAAVEAATRPVRSNPSGLAPCMTDRVSPPPEDAPFVARLRTPGGGIVDVYSDTQGGYSTWITAAGDRSCVLGKASHSDECAPTADVYGDGTYRRIHTVKGVSQAGAGLGFALYLGSALAAEYRGDKGVFSVPLSVPRRETRSDSADALWKKLSAGPMPLAHVTTGEVYCCSDADFTAAERRTKVYKDWLKSEAEGTWMRRDIDVLPGEAVRRSGYVVALGKGRARRGASLQKEYETALAGLQSVFASLSEAEQARIVDADNEFHAGKPEAFVAWARTIDPAAFPSFGAAEVERPWAEFIAATDR